MAIKRGRPTEARNRFYGPGPEADAANPIFVGETQFCGEECTVISPHGSDFGASGEIPISDSNVMDEILEENSGLGRHSFRNEEGSL